MNIVIKVSCPKCLKHKMHKVKILSIGGKTWLSGSTCYKCGFKFLPSNPDPPIRTTWAPNPSTINVESGHVINASVLNAVLHPVNDAPTSLKLICGL